MAATIATVFPCETVFDIGSVTYTASFSGQMTQKRHIDTDKLTETPMSSGTDTSTYSRFGTLFVQRSRERTDAPWSHSAKVLLWIGLAAASWGLVILAGYLIWSAL